MARRFKRRLKYGPAGPATDEEILAALGWVPIEGSRPPVCPECRGRSCNEYCLTAEKNGWPVETLRERPF